MSDEQESLFRQGVDVETVGNIIDGKDEQPPGPPPLVLPVLEGYPHQFPQPGIYFDMPEDVYHAIPALSTGGIKKLAASPMIYWATCAWMNPEYAELKREQQEKREKLGQDHFDVGHAYHCRVLEGAEAFRSRFCAALDKRDHPNALVTVEDIAAAFPEGIKPRGANKRAKFEHLRTLDATAVLWEDLKAEHAAANEGLCMVPAKTIHQLEVAAAMIERDPEIGPAIQGGYAEVSLFWRCPVSGVPMKARVDKLQVRKMIDLKTLENTREASIENAIRNAIANNRYGLQPSVYLEGGAVVRALVRERAEGRVWGWGPMNKGGEDMLPVYEPVPLTAADPRFQYALKWAQHRVEDAWLWIFQQKGYAPISRGVFYPTRGTTRMLFDDIMRMMKKRMRQFVEHHGLDMWVDSKPIYDLADEDLPPWATEI